MAKILCFVETREDVNSALENVDNINQVIFIPISIDADFILHSRRIDHIEVSDFLSMHDKESIFRDAKHWSENWLNKYDIDDSKIFYKDNFTLSDYTKGASISFFLIIFFIL